LLASCAKVDGRTDFSAIEETGDLCFKIDNIRAVKEVIMRNGCF